MFKSDIEIAQSVQLMPITAIADKLGIKAEHLELYGNYKAKLNFNQAPIKNKGKLILVTAISPTPAGEGKTTTTVGLGDALNRLKKKIVIALREPSLGPVFGVKGGAAGGGYAQVVPMEDLNLHFTGDFHAIGAANNLLAAMLDNHIQQGNELQIDSRRVIWRRCVDMNDRQLRSIISGLGGKSNGTPREDGFDITVASEIMAVLCLSESLADLKEKLSKIIVAYSFKGKPVTCGDLQAQGALTVLLKDAIKPNLVQTLEHTPVLIHGGPFANIAHGCNSVIATKRALELGDYVVTEAGFGADLGAEKFLDIKCRKSGLNPSAVVVVATVRALKYHGGVELENLSTPDEEALRRGLPNLLRHVDNIKNKFGLPCVVAINRFTADSEGELELIRSECKKLGVNVALSEVWGKGGLGGEELAKEVLALCENESKINFIYKDSNTIKEKIRQVATKIYGAKGVAFSPAALSEMRRITNLGLAHLPICVAKTQYSFSDNPELKGAPSDFEVTVRGVKASAGAGFIVVYLGEIMTMPGLPKEPAAQKIDIDDDGKIVGLF